jgi:serine/threonine protein kinase
MFVTTRRPQRRSLDALAVAAAKSFEPAALSYKERARLSHDILAAFRCCVRVGSVGARPIYHLHGVGDLFIGPFVDVGGYNRVTYGELCNEKVVVRTLIRNPSTYVKGARAFLVEQTVHAALNGHPNVPRLIAAFKTKREDNTGCRLSSVMQHIKGKSMYDLLKKKILTSNEVFSVLMSTLNVLRDLEDKHKFEHRDLRSDNIMVVPTRRRVVTASDGVGNEYEYDNYGHDVVLIDFGFARVTLKNGTRLCANFEHILRGSNDPSPGIDAAMLLYTLNDDNLLPSVANKAVAAVLIPFIDMLPKDLYKECAKDQERWDAFQGCFYLLPHYSMLNSENVMRAISGYSQGAVTPSPSSRGRD